MGAMSPAERQLLVYTTEAKISKLKKKQLIQLCYFIEKLAFAKDHPCQSTAFKWQSMMRDVLKQREVYGLERKYERFFDTYGFMDMSVKAIAELFPAGICRVDTIVDVLSRVNG